jgi:hypothetical protein
MPYPSVLTSGANVPPNADGHHRATSGLPRFGLLSLLIVALLCVVSGCRRTNNDSSSSPPSKAAKEGEPDGPDQYSARVVRTIDIGGKSQSQESRFAISGALIREEWTDQGERRALILRPDLGKSYMLWLEKGAYTESPINPDSVPSDDMAKSHAEAETAESKSSSDLSNQADAGPREQSTSKGSDKGPFDYILEPPPSPVRTEDRTLPDQIIDNHNCQVREHLGYFADGHVERSRTFRAVDLKGLAIRIEIWSDSAIGSGGSAGPSPTVLTQRLDVRLDVPASEFSIPPDFKRTESPQR